MKNKVGPHRASDGSEPAVLVVTPTGLSAVVIGGDAQTFYTALGLMPSNTRRDGITPPTGQRLYDAQRRLRNIRAIIFDECSMIAGPTFEAISREVNRFLGVTRHDVLFANLDIYAFGDLLQLPPIRPPGPIFTSALWRHFAFIELTGNLRAGNDRQFVGMLRELGVGIVTPETDAALRQRMVNPATGVAPFPDAITLLPRRIAVRAHNRNAEESAIRAIASGPVEVSGGDNTIAQHVRQFQMAIQRPSGDMATTRAWRAGIVRATTSEGIMLHATLLVSITPAHYGIVTCCWQWHCAILWHVELHMYVTITSHTSGRCCRHRS